MGNHVCPLVADMRHITLSNLLVLTLWQDFQSRVASYVLQDLILPHLLQLAEQGQNSDIGGQEALGSLQGLLRPGTGREQLPGALSHLHLPLYLLPHIAFLSYAKGIQKRKRLFTRTKEMFTQIVPAELMHKHVDSIYLGRNLSWNAG